MNKKELFYKYTDFTTLQNIGAGWVGQAKQYVAVGQWVTEAAMYKIFLSQWNVPIATIFIVVIVKYYAWMVINWLMGKLAIKVGVYKAQQQYGAKKEHLNPYNIELINTLKAICEKVGAKDAFSDL